MFYLRKEAACIPELVAFKAAVDLQIEVCDDHVCDPDASPDCEA